jgi:hypothetical protein
MHACYGWHTPLEQFHPASSIEIIAERSKTMKNSRRWLPVIVAGALATIATTACAGEEGAVKIQFSDAPPAVRKTMKREANGGKIETVDIQTHDGKLVFEADVKIDGTNYEILVAKDGRLISKAIDEEEEDEDEAEDEDKGNKEKQKGEQKEKEHEGEAKNLTVIKFSEAPAAVRKTLKREAFGAKIVKVDIESRHGKRVYEADVEIDGKNYEILVAKDGSLISKALDEEEEEEGVESEKERNKDKKKEKEDDEDDD